MSGQHFTLGRVACGSWGNTSEFFPHSRHWHSLRNIFQRRRWSLLRGSPMAPGKGASPQSRSITAGSFLKHAGAFWRPCSWSPLTALHPELKHKAWKLMLGSFCFTSSLLPTGSGPPAFHAEPKQAKNLSERHIAQTIVLCAIWDWSSFLLRTFFSSHSLPTSALSAPELLSNYLVFT